LKREPEDRAFATGVPHPNSTMVLLDNGSADVQPESEA
jgi:hypothetical protein